MQKIRIEFILDDEISLERVREDIRSRFLGTLSDYQRDNIGMFSDNNILTIQAFQDDIHEPARYRSAMKDLLDYIVGSY